MVSEVHVAAVRALLIGDVDEHLRLIGEIDRAGSVEAYGAFYRLAFVEAARRRFGAEATRGDVIRFVARTRAGWPRGAEDFDILAAERLLLAVLGDQAAAQRLTEDDTALVGPLLLELGRALPAEELLAHTQEMIERLGAAVPDGGSEGEE